MSYIQRFNIPTDVPIHKYHVCKFTGLQTVQGQTADMFNDRRAKYGRTSFKG